MLRRVADASERVLWENGGSDSDAGFHKGSQWSGVLHVVIAVIVAVSSAALTCEMMTGAALGAAAVAGDGSVADSTIPDDVAHYFAHDAAHDVVEFEKAADTSDSAFNAATLSITDIQKTYSIDKGGDGKLRLVSSDQWTAVVRRGNNVAGTSTVWRDEEGVLQSGWSDGVEQAEHLALASRTGAQYVEVGWAHAAFLRCGGKLIPLDSFTEELVPEPMSETDVLTVLQSEYDESVESVAAEHTDAVLRYAAVGAGAFAVLLLGALTAWWLRRRARERASVAESDTAS